MDSKTHDLIKELAAKLGTTTEYLWRVLVSQAPISATVDLLFVIGTFILTILLYKKHKKISAQEQGYWGTEDAMGTMIFGGLILFGLLVYSACSINNIITGFFNPEYWALKNILKNLQ